MSKLTLRALELFEGGEGWEAIDENENVIFDNQTYYPTHPSREWAERIVAAVNGALPRAGALIDAPSIPTCGPIAPMVDKAEWVADHLETNFFKMTPSEVHAALDQPAKPEPHMMSAFEIRPKHIAKLNGVWVAMRETRTEVGGGRAETSLSGREFFKGRTIELTVPCDWRFETGEEAAIIAGAFEPQPAPTDFLKRLRQANIDRNAEYQATTGGEALPLLFRTTEFAGEVGELLNVIKKLERERLGWSGKRASREDMVGEFGGVGATFDLLAMDLGVDLAQAITDEFNSVSDRLGLKTKL